MDSINFKAKFVQPTVIKSRTANGRYNNMQASIVKFCNSTADKNSLRNVVEIWDKKDSTFAELMVEIAFDNPCKSLYVLTKQSSNYKKLNPNEVLGMFEFEQNENVCVLNYIQTHPDCINSKCKKPYKGIGKAMMDSLLKLTNCKKIYLKSVMEAVKFYEKLGFKVKCLGALNPLMYLEK